MELGVKKVAMSQRLKPKNLTRTFYLDTKKTLDEVPFANEIPQPKPQELLDIQEKNKKQRLLNSLNKIGGRLEDTSLDFINRENFDRGGMAKLVEYVESLPDGTVITGKMIDDYIQKNNLKVNAMNFFTRKAPSIKGKTFDTSYQGSRLSDLEKANIEKYGKERYDKLNTTQQYRVRRGENVGVLAPEKTQKVKFKKAYDDAKNFYESQGIKFDDKIKERTRKSIAANEGKFIPPGKGAKVFKASTMKTVRDVFVNNPDADGEEIARAMVGDKKFNAASLIEKEELIKDANRQVPKFVQLFSPGSKETIKGFKDIKPDKLVDILESIEEKTNEFGFDGQNRRELQFAIADAGRGLPERTTIKAREKLLTKGKDVDEVVGVSATFKNAPGYIEATQVIDKKINALKGKQIDLDFNRAFTAALEGDYSKVEDFNIKSKAFQKKYKVDTPIIKIGENLNPKDFVSGFKNYSPGAQKNIKQIAKEKGIVIETKAQPIKLKTPTATDSKNIAKKLASFGFKCSAAEGGACDNPMNYLDDIKKQQAIAKGSGNAAANAVKKLSAGKAIMREFIGPGAALFELAAAIPITYLGYKAGLPPARIVADATYGLFGDTEKARLKKIAVDEGIDTAGLDKVFEFQDKSKAIQTIASQEQDFRGPDDEFQYQQQYDKGEEDFYKAVGAFRDKAGNVSKDVYKKFGSQLQQLRDYIAKLDADRAAERSSRIANSGIGDYIDFNSGGRVNYSNGSDGTALAIEESLEAFQRYLRAGGKLSYKDFIAVGNEGVGKFFNAGGRVGFADGPDNPKRRTFMKVMAGIASLPILGKFFKGAKTAKVVKLTNTTTNMPDWFPNFVENAFAKGIGKKIDADLTELEVPELPGVKVLAHDDGRIRVEGKNAYDETYEIEYTPPGYEVVDETTGKTVKTSGEFQAMDTQFRRTGSPDEMDYDVDYEIVKDVDDILGGNATQLEGFAKGTNKTKETRGSNLVDKAEADLERADVYDPYEGVDGSDFTDD